jgi:alanyl-tRNA synthetase
MAGKVTTADDLRTAWMAFFEARGHTAWPSASLVPENDPTLLFTGAGMNQFKDMFLGKGNLPFRRAATIQKCFRQGDLDNVGRTPRHLTFFEMMGHFSFGDYFKKEAIAWAWEFLRDVVALPTERLFVSVYQDDDVAYEAWQAVGVPRERIARFDAKENFWPADAPASGPNGPCGPCTEIFYDYGREAERGDGSKASYDSGRYVEIWNSVFTQYERRGPDQLEPLPQRNIDCGAGLERVLAALEGQQSPFGTSLFRPLVMAVAELAGVPYVFDPKGGQTPGDDARRVRRIAEHARAACFLVGDGVKPGNEGRGYVLRRVLRRAIRDGIQLGLEETFLHRLVGPVLDVMGTSYPALREGQDVLETTLRTEDERFRETYRAGVRYLDEELERLGQARTLPGPVAFKLYDTYGFPLDLAEVILAERGIAVDTAGFEAEMEAQRERARAGSKLKGDIFAGGPITELKSRQVPATVFTGYGHPGLEDDAAVVGVIDAAGHLAARAGAGAEVTLVLDRTPFYAESGGQVGDRGEVRGAGFVVAVEDTQKSEGFHLHRGRVVEGEVVPGTPVRAIVDGVARAATRRNHTATHLLHEALHRVLGDDVRQEGSLVAPDRLRFDFRHDQALSAEQIDRIETLVDGWILVNEPVATDVMDLEAAKASGAMALFGEKYDSKVRVVHVASGSRELCGGTHCARTGDIGAFRIVVETSIAAGVRRIEAVTGLGASSIAREQQRTLRDVGQLLKARPEQLVERIEALQEEVRTLRKQIEKSSREAGAAAARDLVDGAAVVGDLRVQVTALPGVDAKGLKAVWSTLAAGGIDVAVLVGEQGDKAPVLTAVGEKGLAAGVDARRLLDAVTGVLGGGGGGKPAMAQGQGQDRSALAAALAAATEAVRGALAA